MAFEKLESCCFGIAGLPTGFSYANGKNTAITYNSRNMTTQINAGTAYNTSFGYDSRGNTTSITDNLPATPVLTHKIDPSKGSLQTTTYGYSSNRIISLSGAETASYSYSGRGDMTSLTEQGVTFTPEYDLLHNLRAYKQGTTTLAAYGYDGDGMRVLKTTGGVTTVYHHDKSGKLLSETDTNGNRIADYVYVNGNMAAKVDNAGIVSYYHTDPAGTPTAITDSAGALIWRAEYLPFGEEQLLVNNKTNDKMFVGKEKDEETGLYYFGARYLQDRNARFVSVDPVGPVDSENGKVNEKMLVNPQKMNRYAYAINNPYRYVDPDGRELIPIYLPGIGNTHLDDSFAPKVSGFMINTGEKGVELIFNSAYRTPEQQEALKTDPKAITPADKSLHSAGFAVDVNFSSLADSQGGLTGNEKRDVIKKSAAKAGLDWGGNFKDPDPPHFYHDPGGKRETLIKNATSDYKKLNGDHQ